MQSINRLLDPLRRSVRLMVARGVIKLVNNSTKVQELQVALLNGEVRDGVEHFQHYGFSSVPLPGGEYLAVFVGGRRSHGIVIANDDRRYRPTTWEPGEVGLYDHLGKFLVLKANGDVHITATRVVIDGDVQINGDVAIDGNLHATGTVLDDDGNTNHHTHS